MLFPAETLMGWAAAAVLTGLLVWRAPRHWLLWGGLALMVSGAVYYPAVMAHRPQHYYALLEFLVSSLAFASGLVAAAVGAFRLLFLGPARCAAKRPDDVSARGRTP
jgi:hypothetical protein